MGWDKRNYDTTFILCAGTEQTLFYLISYLPLISNFHPSRLIPRLLPPIHLLQFHFRICSLSISYSPNSSSYFDLFISKLEDSKILCVDLRFKLNVFFSDVASFKRLFFTLIGDRDETRVRWIKQSFKDFNLNSETVYVNYHSVYHITHTEHKLMMKCKEHTFTGMDQILTKLWLYVLNRCNRFWWW